MCSKIQPAFISLLIQQCVSAIKPRLLVTIIQATETNQDILKYKAHQNIFEGNLFMRWEWILIRWFSQWKAEYSIVWTPLVLFPHCIHQQYPGAFVYKFKCRTSGAQTISQIFLSILYTSNWFLFPSNNVERCASNPLKPAVHLKVCMFVENFPEDIKSDMSTYDSTSVERQSLPAPFRGLRSACRRFGLTGSCRRKCLGLERETENKCSATALLTKTTC